MRKLVITLSIVLISLLGYSQVTNVGEYRVANATTDFGVNLPIGTKVYNIATGEYWVATAGVASSEDLTSASGSFALLNNSGTDDQTAAEVNITDAGGKYDATTVEAALAEIANAGYLTSEVDGSVTNEIQTIDTARLNGTTLEFSLSSDGEDKKEIDLSSLQDGIGTDDQIASEVNITDTDGDYTSGTVEGALAEIGDSIAGLRTDIDQNASDISDNATAIAGITSNLPTSLETGTVNGTTYGITSDGGTDDIVLAAATNSAAGVATAAQITKLEGIATGAEVNLDLITEKFEEDDGTATAHTLSQTAVVSQGCRVSLNGATLDPVNYTFATGSITIGVPVYQYDQVVITYSY